MFCEDGLFIFFIVPVFLLPHQNKKMCCHFCEIKPLRERSKGRGGGGGGWGGWGLV